jgi:hypothetical protein
LTSRSSFEDNPNPLNNHNFNPNNNNLTGNKPVREIGFSMFLMEESKASSKQERFSTVYKDSLDHGNSNNDASSDEVWKNEMLIYEKYLKDDYQKFETNYLNDFEPAKSTTNDVLTAKINDNGATKKVSNKMKAFHENLTAIQNDKPVSNDSRHNIEKLKSSVDTLRRDLHNDIQTNDAKLQTNILNDLKRKLAARKIQKWYRRHCLRKKSGEAALKRHVVLQVFDINFGKR